MITKYEVSTKLHQGLISLIVPAFNEEENLPALIHRLRAVMEPYGAYEILIIDDGSSDQTRHVLRQLSRAYPVVRFISFSCNFGYRMALRAGYENARGEAVICLDADLQHPPELIPTLIDKWRDGYDIVQAIQKLVPANPAFHQTPGLSLSTLLRTVLTLVTSGKPTRFRLLDRSVVDRMNQTDANRLLNRRALPTAGFRRCRIHYQPAARYAGRSTYAVQTRPQPVIGISFSTRLLYGLGLAGFGVFSLITLFGAELLNSYLFAKATAFDWATLAQLVALAAGAQFILTGIIAGFMGKTAGGVNPYPAYIIGDTSDFTGRVTDRDEAAAAEPDLDKVRLMYRSLTPQSSLHTTVC